MLEGFKYLFVHAHISNYFFSSIYCAVARMHAQVINSDLVSLCTSTPSGKSWPGSGEY